MTTENGNQMDLIVNSNKSITFCQKKTNKMIYVQYEIKNRWQLYFT